MPLQRVPSFLITVHRFRLTLPGLHCVIFRDALQAAFPDPAVRLISIVLSRQFDGARDPMS